MPVLVTNCPRCGSRKITFDLTQDNFLGTQYGWQYVYEAFCVCRHCKKATIFILEQKTSRTEDAFKAGLASIKGAINDYMTVEGFINLKDTEKVQPPEYLPENVKSAFKEGATCLAVGCHNAAGTMFRLCLDLATRSKLPAEDSLGLNAKVRRDLGLRLPWLFDNGHLPADLRELSSCVKDDGNDGAHAGSLQKNEAEDLLDFTTALLERIYTEPERLRLAKERRESRRATPPKAS
jgi:hypothetical protein